jgi:uncharacterized protein YfaS (alpha-2-macroglobulin family)
MMAKSEIYYPGYPGNNSGKVETFAGKTDASGTHYLNLDFEVSGDPQPVSIQAQASVMDVNRQAWAGSTDLLVHPASVYVGLRSQKYFVERGTPIQVDYIVADLDGNPAPGLPVEITAARLEWKYKDGQWGEVEVDPQTCSQTSAAEPATCTFETPVGGSYRITAIVKDDQGRLNRSRLTRWVSGGQIPPARNIEQEQVTLIPDKESYQPGDVAQILVQSPFSPAEGLLTVSRSGILYTQRFQVQDGAATLSIPIEEKYIPNLSIQVDLSGSAPRTDDPAVGAVTTTIGGVRSGMLLTSTETAPDSVVFPAASRAFAISVWVPFGTAAVFQLVVYGKVVSSGPKSMPSSAN